MNLPTTIVYEANRDALSPIVVNRGGARSSKSYSLSQLMLEKILTIPYIKILVLRKDWEEVKFCTIPLFKEIINKMQVDIKQTINRFYNLKKGSFIQCDQISNLENLKQVGGFDIIWVEEASDFDLNELNSIMILFKDKLYFSFNPESDNLPINAFISSLPFSYDEFVSTYKDNPYLSPEFIETLEDLKNDSMELYNVYALGEYPCYQN